MMILYAGSLRKNQRKAWFFYYLLIKMMIFFAGNRRERIGEKFDSQTMYGFGRRIGHDQIIFLCGREWIEEAIAGKVARVAKFEICAFALHSNNGFVDKNFRFIAERSR